MDIILKNQDLATFEVLDFYMIRAPLFPINFFKEIFPHSRETTTECYDILINLSKNSVIREAIGIASPSLLHDLTNLENLKSNKKKKKVIQSLIRYLIRLSTRPTPFGIFSGVTIGKWNHLIDKALVEFDMYKKRARPDMEWLFKVIKMIESDINIVSQLHVSLNSMCYKVGSRVHIPYLQGYGQKKIEPMEKVSFKLTEALDFVMENAQKEILFRNLISLLLEKYPSSDQDTITNFLWQLFQNELLISELRPPILTISPFEYLLNKLQKVVYAKGLFDKLNKINKKINEYNNTELGQGVMHHKKLVEEMNNLQEVNTPLQVDLSIITKESVLSNIVKREVEKVTDVMIKLSPNSTIFPHLEFYKVEFAEKYGPYREIPLLELLDEDTGLGPPPTYEFPPSVRYKSYTKHIRESHQKREEYLWQLYYNEIAKGNNEIQLNDLMIEKLNNFTEDLRNLPLSLDIYLEVHAYSREDVNKGDFRLVLGPNVSSSRAGQSFGRFCDLLGEDTLNKISQKERELCPEAIFAEISYLPNAGRAANVMLTENIRSHEITFGTNSSKPPILTISLSDLIVGYTGQRLYIKSLSLNKEIIPTTGHMLNYNGAPNAYRFLREICIANEKILQPFDWGSLVSAPRLPRVSYGRTILSLARWRLDHNIIPFKDNMSKEDWYLEVNKWRENYNVPNYVYLANHDNRLLFNLDNYFHLEELYLEFSKLRNNHSLLLTETNNVLENCWVKSSQGQHVIECVFPLIKNGKFDPFTQAEEDKHITNKKIILDKDRNYYPGSEWLFIKLYSSKNREDELIGSQIKDFCSHIMDKEIIDKYFYMRYKDPQSHIRLRFNGCPEQLTSKLLPIIYEWSKKLVEEGLITHYIVDTYERELERYGGLQLIELAENLFYVDSQICAEWLGYTKSSNELKIGNELFAVISIVDYLDNFGLTLEKKLSLLNKVVYYKDFLMEFRDNKSEYVNYANPYNEWSDLNKSQEGEVVVSLLTKRKYAVQAYNLAIDKLWYEEKLSTSKEDIILSVIHLHLNRLIGGDRQREKKVMTLARHTLKSLQFRNKY